MRSISFALRREAPHTRPFLTPFLIHMYSEPEYTRTVEVLRGYDLSSTTALPDC